MPKTVSVLGSGVLAGLIALEAAPNVTWRTGIVAAIAFLGGIGIPAIHSAGSTE
jgi:Zn-dependent alcohol dehydrogenase